MTVKGNGEALKGDKYVVKGNNYILKGNGNAFNCNKKYSRLQRCIKGSL